MSLTRTTSQISRSPDHAEGLGGGTGSTPRPAPAVDLTDATGRLSSADLDWLAQMARRALEVQSLTGSLSARIVGDNEMAAAHAEFCGVDGTTDVITFDLTDPEDNAPAKGIVDAELILCLDEAERQAKARGHEARRELLLYVVHGVLHCLGHDDHEEAAYARMHAEEDRLLTLLGVGVTFNRDQHGGAA